MGHSFHHENEVAIESVSLTLSFFPRFSTFSVSVPKANLMLVYFCSWHPSILVILVEDFCVLLNLSVSVSTLWRFTCIASGDRDLTAGPQAPGAPVSLSFFLSPLLDFSLFHVCTCLYCSAALAVYEPILCVLLKVVEPHHSL